MVTTSRNKSSPSRRPNIIKEIDYADEHQYHLIDTTLLSQRESREENEVLCSRSGQSQRLPHSETNHTLHGEAHKYDSRSTQACKPVVSIKLKTPTTIKVIANV